MKRQQPRVYINSAKKQEAQLAVQSIVDATMETGINYAFSLPVTPAHWEAGNAVGKARLAIKKLRGRAEHEGRGADDERVDTDGATAELLLGFVFEHVGADIAALVAHKPDFGGLDLHLGGLGLDAKSIGVGKGRVCINHDQHYNKAADVYVLVQFVTAWVADVYVVQAEEVSGWELVKNLRGKALDKRRWYYPHDLPQALEPLQLATAA